MYSSTSKQTTAYRQHSSSKQNQTSWQANMAMKQYAHAHLNSNTLIQHSIKILDRAGSLTAANIYHHAFDQEQKIPKSKIKRVNSINKPSVSQSWHQFSTNYHNQAKPMENAFVHQNVNPDFRQHTRPF